MDNRAHWHTLLREALTLLALPADEQVRLNGPGCVACDLINDFNHARRVTFDEAKLSNDQRQALESIARAIQAMEEADVECYKNGALRRPAWDRLRERASEALRVFGWEKAVIKPFAEVSPGVWFRAPDAAPSKGGRDSGAISLSMPNLAIAKEASRSRVPYWVVLAGCLSVFVFLLLCGTAIGVWVYVLKNGYVFGTAPTNVDPAFNSPAVPLNFGQPLQGEVVNGRLVEPEGGFSYVPPDGWMAYRLPGLKYRIVSAPIQAGGAPNINAADEFFAGSLEEYVKANLATLQRVMPEFRIVKQEDFQTTAGLPSVRLVAEVKQNGINLRQSYYFFGNGNTKYVVVCTTRRDGGEELDPIFEASMKSFRLERQ